MHALRDVPGPAQAGTLDVEIVVPVYNEQEDLVPCVRRLHDYLRDFPFSTQITIADNASTDATLLRAYGLAAELPDVRVVHLDAKGRGRALHTVWSASTASVVAYMDVDLSTDLSALLPLVAPLMSGHSDVAIGSRLSRSARVVRGPRREVISRCYNVLLRTVLRARFSDAQCGFKAMRTVCARALLPHVHDNDWFFDTELLVLAERSGLRIAEVPVDWVDNPDSRVDVVATALADLRGVARVGHALATGALPLRDLRQQFGRHPIDVPGVPKPLSWQAIRFASIGVLSTIAYLALFLLLRAPFGAQAANLAALLLTAVANTAANRRFTFGVVGAGVARHQAQGLVVFGLGLALTSGSLALLAHAYAHPPRLIEVTVLVAANLAATALRFVLLRHWVFASSKGRVMTAVLTPPASSAGGQLPRRWAVTSAHLRRKCPPALVALLGGTAALYLWGLSASGYGNEFYAAAVQAGTKSWKAFFFGSLDQSNFITVDKPPLSLWPMELAGRLFGFNSWTLLAPQALEGVLAVALLYATVRRWFGPAAALIAGAVLAVTPVAVLMFRFDQPDALMTLLLVAAAYFVTRAIDDGRLRWMLLAGGVMGLNFLTKGLQPFTVLPALALVYLVASDASLRRRIAHLLAAGAALVAGAAWWVLAVALWPAADRPYIGGSTNNSALDLAFGYNGLGRITGNETGAGGGGGGGGPTFSGQAGIGRLFNSEMGTQIAWLLPAALIALAALVALARRAPRTDRTRAAALLWGGWLVVTGLVLSYAGGIIHPYYTVELAPAIAALVGIGSVLLWRQRADWRARVALATGVAVTGLWSFQLLARTPDWNSWLRLVLLVVALGAATALLVPPQRLARGAVAVGVAGLVVVTGASSAYALSTAAASHNGSTPSAGPASAAGVGGARGRSWRRPHRHRRIRRRAGRHATERHAGWRARRYARGHATERRLPKSGRRHGRHCWRYLEFGVGQPAQEGNHPLGGSDRRRPERRIDRTGQWQGRHGDRWLERFGPGAHPRPVQGLRRCGRHQLLRSGRRGRSGRRQQRDRQLGRSELHGDDRRRIDRLRPDESQLVTTTLAAPPAGGQFASRWALARAHLRRKCPPGLVVLLTATAALYTWGLSRSGWANQFYAAAAQSGSKSWTAFLFGSLDQSNFITVDKPPASLWVMDISVRLFGLNSWSILVPQALEGVAAVALLYAAVRRVSTPTAGLLAGAILATTPVATLMFRFDNPDALLVLLMTAAAYATVRATERASARWLMLAGAVIGFAFLTKMLQGLLVVPGLGAAYLVAAPTTLRRRIGHLLAALGAMIVAAGWWIALVELWPAGSRPYIGGTNGNSILELTFGYNGLGRLDGASNNGNVSGGTGGFSSGQTGVTRLFGTEMGAQISWLLPAALVAIAALAWLTARRPRTDTLRASLIVWGGWLLVTGGVLSFASGIIHPYYTVALAPAIAALVGLGVATLWRSRQSEGARWVLAALVAAAGWWTFELLGRSDWMPWLRWVVLLAGAAAVGAVLAARSALLVATTVAAAMLGGPVAYSLQTAATAHTGAIPSAGPASSGFGGGPGGRRRTAERPSRHETGCARRQSGRCTGRPRNRRRRRRRLHGRRGRPRGWRSRGRIDGRRRAQVAAHGQCRRLPLGGRDDRRQRGGLTRVGHRPGSDVARRLQRHRPGNHAQRVQTPCGARKSALLRIGRVGLHRLGRRAILDGVPDPAMDHVDVHGPDRRQYDGVRPDVEHRRVAALTNRDAEERRPLRESTRHSHSANRGPQIPNRQGDAARTPSAPHRESGSLRPRW